MSGSSVWSSQSDYPFGTVSLHFFLCNSISEIFRQAPFIYSYSIVSLGNSFYIFGGYDTTNTIASFDTNTKQWIRVGELNQARDAHAVIVRQGQFVVVGGCCGSLATERCILTDNKVQCTTIDPELNNFYWYPEMMLVSGNYCSN